MDTVNSSAFDILKGDEEASKSFLFSSPWPVITLTAFYLYFVLRLGPDYMRKKQALEMKLTLQVYNSVQIVFSAWWFLKAISFISQTGVREFSSAIAQCSRLPQNFIDEIKFHACLYLASKLVELLDTIFFVLRRKQNQVTFLHVYHHANMLVSTWFFIRDVPAIQSLPIGIFNTLVHVIMYGYYFLSSLGEGVRKYLWWKKYLTGFQIVQFVMIICYLLLLITFGCSVSTSFVMFSVGNTSSFLILFSNFYLKSYLTRSVKMDVKKSS